jgi:hypothetical protein
LRYNDTYFPGSSPAQTHTALLSSPRPVPVGEKCGAAS